MLGAQRATGRLKPACPIPTPERDHRDAKQRR